MCSTVGTAAPARGRDRAGRDVVEHPSFRYQSRDPAPASSHRVSPTPVQKAEPRRAEERKRIVRFVVWISISTIVFTGVFLALASFRNTVRRPAREPQRIHVVL